MVKSWFFVVTVPLVLCSEPNIVVVPKFGSVSQVMEFTLNNTIKYLLLFHPDNTSNPYSIKAWSDSSSQYNPILIVVNQGMDTLSWSVPFSINQTEVYYNTSRTLCDSNIKNFTITLSTLSPNNTKVSVFVTEERFFHIVNGKTHTIEILPSEPRYFSYDYVPESNSSIVIIEIDSDGETCWIVSVQQHKCPVLDSNNFINYQGFHQTILTKGGMRIRKKYYPGGFFLVFLVVEDEVCYKKNLPIIPNHNQSSIVHFTVIENIESKNHYILAISVVIGCLIIFSIVTIATFCVFEKYRRRNILENNQVVLPININEEIPMMSNNKKRQGQTFNGEEQENTNDNNQKENEERLEASLDDYSQNIERNQKRSMNYLWQILNVGIFYLIPAIQLVVTLQSLLIQTGDFDMCYYNFRCANPLWIFSDFNHVFSNIGYIVAGILFCFNVFYRHFYSPPLNIGVPANYGVFYAMGVALIIEGVLSGCYHLCPNQLNFQFDTSFMYVMVVLCLVKLYQNRHSDVTPTAYTTFSILGGTILCGTIGIIFKGPPIFVAVVIIVFLLLLIYISLNIYYFGAARNVLRRFRQRNFEDPNLAPPNTHRWRSLIIAVAINIAIIILGLVLLYCTDKINFGSFILLILASNALLYTLMYTCMKRCVYGERICVQAVIYGVLAAACLIPSGMFFFNQSSKWTVGSCGKSPKTNNFFSRKVLLNPANSTNNASSRTSSTATTSGTFSAPWHSTSPSCTCCVSTTTFTKDAQISLYSKINKNFL